MDTRAAIESAIPHRPPMLMVDEVIAADATTIHCRKRFNGDEFFFQGHFPDHPLVPGVILCECALQAGALLVGLGAEAPEGLPMATRMDGVKFKRPVRPGESVDIHVELREHVANAYFMSGRVLVDGRVAARLDFACALAQPE